MRVSNDDPYRDYLRVAAFAPVIALADPERNSECHCELATQAFDGGASIVLFPELSITGFSCEDLFGSADLLHDTRVALTSLCASLPAGGTVVVGAPLRVADGRLYNCAVVIADGKIVGAVPKTHLPNYGEFYDRRWFVSGAGVALEQQIGGAPFSLRADQLFKVGDALFAIEICEDLWAPQATGIAHALAGADILLNPSASNELVAKADYRRDLVRISSAQRLCAYVYASSGPTESTKDVVFGGHLIAAQNGRLISESERLLLSGSELQIDIDLDLIRHERGQHQTFASSERPSPYAIAHCSDTRPLTSLLQPVDPHPFVPADEHEVEARAKEILSIQAAGLARRLRSISGAKPVLAISGGLDSTLAFLVCLDALEMLGESHENLLTLTMPGPGTSDHTLTSARRLAAAANVPLREIPITDAVVLHLRDLGHDQDRHDVVFENAQARERTQLLFDYANQCAGIVVGTGDLSELALGWCTYNADQMASYNVNVGVPKTLVAYIVRWYARHQAADELRQVLERVVSTPISPELVPGSDSRIEQLTEAIIGPYELHDFFLFYFVRHGFRFTKVFDLAAAAYAGRYDIEAIGHWLCVFVRRFFGQQFKRTTLPPGPKIGTVSLSPRGDWRMPDEVGVERVVAQIEARVASAKSEAATKLVAN